MNRKIVTLFLLLTFIQFFNPIPFYYQITSHNTPLRIKNLCNFDIGECDFSIPKCPLCPSNLFFLNSEPNYFPAMPSYFISLSEVILFNQDIIYSIFKPPKTLS